MSKVVYLGHSAVSLITDCCNVIIDPFLNDNPLSPIKAEQCKSKYILVTHGHSDHLGDTVEIAKRNNATVIAPFEITQYVSQKGVKNVHPMNIGGKFKFEFGTVKMVGAFHSSSITEGDKIIYAGNPAGYVIELPDLKVYHAGDTSLFLNMEIIGGQTWIDIAFLPIGGNFTMDIHDAVIATKLLHPRVVIPIHYNTWDIIKADPEEFKKEVESETNAKCVILKPGEGY
ncbi:MAG: metal-dependent hydrolase [Caldisericaceae bacterium]|nr:metal-dependent hydrolase [Caldisericaceae bacterium]